MSTVNVREVEALERLLLASEQYRVDAAQILRSIEQQVQATEAWLQQALVRWEMELETRTRLLQQAESGLRRCMASGFVDRNGCYHRPDCSREQECVTRAGAEVRAAQRALAEINEARGMLGRASAAYREQAVLLSRTIAEVVPSGVQFLSRKVADLRASLAAPMPGGATGIASGTSPTTSGASSTASPSARAGVPGPGSLRAAGFTKDGRALHLVPVDAMWDDTVTGPQSFGARGSLSDMVGVVQRWQAVVAPAVAAGADGAYFHALDAQSGVDYAHGYERVYDVFYGLGAMAVDWRDNRYAIANGAHRAFAARTAGVPALPAIVSAGTP